jgi:hypothetical protein
MQLSFCREETKAMADQIQCSTHGELQAGGLAAQAQAVAGPLTRAAIFLVATLKPSFENRGTIRSFCGDLAALLRAVEFRDLEGGLSCVMGSVPTPGSPLWAATAQRAASVPGDSRRSAPCRFHSRRLVVPHVNTCAV